MSLVISVRVRVREGASREYWKGGSLSILTPCSWNHDVISAYQHVVSPCKASCLEDSRASRVYLCLGRSHKLCIKDTDLVSASTTMGGAASSTRIISCGTEALALIIREIIETKGLSIHLHPSVLPDLPWWSTEGPHICTP